jgi:phage regulator Rha-like protein
MKAQLTKVRTTSAGLVSVPARSLECCIYLIRGYRVMFDADLANLYHVPTKVLNQAVKRNLDRFPDDFMFEITSEEERALRSQDVTLDENGEKGRGQHRKYAPYVFTEHGIAMLSSVLRSKRAIQMSIQIVRTFIRMREMLMEHKNLAGRVDKLETAQKRHVSVINMLADEILDIRNPPLPAKRRIGFRTERARLIVQDGKQLGFGGSP